MSADSPPDAAAQPAGWRDALGLLRSLAIYYGVPGRARALRGLYGQIVGPGDLAFDIGAHVGNRTRALRALGCRVVAVEPQRLFHRWLARSLPRDVVLHRLAVGATPGVTDLAISRRHPTVSSGAREWRTAVGANEAFAGVAWDAVERVPCTTLDDLIARHGCPRFCKIDVEGMEPEVLAGLGHALPCIAFEYVPAALDRAYACMDRVTALGDYRFNLVRGETGRFDWVDWVAASEARDRLQVAAADGRPGDVYARLEGSA
jgi:FkbM family methyltransferase